MKRTFLILLAVTAFVCIQQGYKLMTENNYLENLTSGSLSDIADEVVAIPLKTTEQYTINDAKNIRKEGDNLFLLSEETLYRFNRKGEFICRITDPEVIKVAGYVVNPVSQQLIVLGNIDDIHYYSYEGRLIEKKKLKSDLPEHRMSSIAMYKNHIWTTEECLKEDSANHVSYMEKQVIEYDSSFQKLETHKLVQADLGRTNYGISCQAPVLGVAEDTGVVYAYSPTSEPGKLLRDTLFLKEQKENGEQALCSDDILLYPVRFGSRFWISSYYNKKDEDSSYTFCYDIQTNRSWQVQGGFYDNFYQTGQVARLEAMDLYNRSYCFCKSGEEINKAFPEHANEKSPVLFIVKLKA
ncbi:6-bladed beta-propeller [Parabacteroides bouchesdurhonensis]|uniref:6-bladed beta-propeller n=1 Tax=Parabacteroides bouchesdurhonensis TaxID=1936995 RepID=UPI000C831FD0|nr:6-bladed beta-propeller [Parabacteroides bouchesdurhonensis]